MPRNRSPRNKKKPYDPWEESRERITEMNRQWRARHNYVRQRHEQEEQTAPQEKRTKANNTLPGC
jgi:hypothetical protein